MYPSCCHAAMPVPPAIGPDDLAGLEFIYPQSGPRRHRRLRLRRRRPAPTRSARPAPATGRAAAAAAVTRHRLGVDVRVDGVQQPTWATLTGTPAARARGTVGYSVGAEQRPRADGAADRRRHHGDASTSRATSTPTATACPTRTRSRSASTRTRRPAPTAPAAIPTATAGPTCRNSRRSPARIRAASSAATWPKARSTRSSRPRSPSSTPTRRRREDAGPHPAGRADRAHDRDQRAEPDARDAVDADARRADDGAVLDADRIRSSAGGRSHDELGRQRLRLARRDRGRRAVDRPGTSPRARPPARSRCSTCCRTRTRRRRARRSRSCARPATRRWCGPTRCRRTRAPRCPSTTRRRSWPAPTCRA